MNPCIQLGRLEFASKCSSERKISFFHCSTEKVELRPSTSCAFNKLLHQMPIITLNIGLRANTKLSLFSRQINFKFRFLMCIFAYHNLGNILKNFYDFVSSCVVWWWCKFCGTSLLFLILVLYFVSIGENANPLYRSPLSVSRKKLFFLEKEFKLIKWSIY